jgi:uncharacterized protein YcfL
MMRSIVILTVSLATILLSGCSIDRVVRVVDVSGKPVSGAHVQAVSLSINSHPNSTDDNGRTLLPSNIQGTKWVVVSKAGYQSIQIEIPQTWPLSITLYPSTE